MRYEAARYAFAAAARSQPPSAYRPRHVRRPQRMAYRETAIYVPDKIETAEERLIGARASDEPTPRELLLRQNTRIVRLICRRARHICRSPRRRRRVVERRHVTTTNVRFSSPPLFTSSVRRRQRCHRRVTSHAVLPSGNRARHSQQDIGRKEYHRRTRQ